METVLKKFNQSINQSTLKYLYLSIKEKVSLKT